MGILIKLDLLFFFSSSISILVIAALSLREKWKFRRLQEDAKFLFRGVKSQIMTILERTEPILEVEEGDVEVQEVTPDDHVEIQKILRKVEMFLSSNDFESAEKLLVEALAFNANDEDVNTLLAFVYMKRKKYTKAESIYIHLAEMNVQDPSIYSNLGKVLEAQDNFEQAVLAYKEAIKRDPHNSARYAQIGNLHMRMQHTLEAIESYEQAVRFDTRNCTYLFALGENYLKSDGGSLAAKVYERILEIEPYNEKAKLHYLDLKEKGYIK